MASQKKEIEILLSFIDGSRMAGLWHGEKHILAGELMLPRVGISTRSVSSTVELQGGVMDARGFAWYRRILFKDSVERRFALRFKLSESLSQTALRSAMRYIGSAMFGAAGSAVEDLAGGIAGDVLASPFAYAKKRLQQTIDTEYLLEGGIDLDASELEESMDIEVPLFAAREIYLPAKSRGRGDAHSEGRKLLLKEGERAGLVSVTLNLL